MSQHRPIENHDTAGESLGVEEILKEFLGMFDSVPAISGSITDSDECCSCGEELGLELYEAFSTGYEMAVSDIESFIRTSFLAGAEAHASATRVEKLNAKEYLGWEEADFTESCDTSGDYEELARFHKHNEIITEITAKSERFLKSLGEGK